MKLGKLDLITLTVAVFVPAAAYLGFFKHRVDKLGRLSESQAELEQQTADAQKTNNDIAQAQKNTVVLKRRLSKFIGSVTGRDDAARAVDALIRNAKEAGVKIELIRPGEPVEGRGLSCLPVSLAASADFASLYNFLVRVERGAAVVTINEMELESDPLSARCAVKMQLRIYFVRAGKAGRKETQT